MENFDAMSKREKLKYLYHLLPSYFGENEEEEYYLDRLWKAIFSKNQKKDRKGKGQSIGEQLKGIGFDLDKYSEVDKFAFLLSHILLTHAQRQIVSQKSKRIAEVYPNQKLISSVKKIDVDTDIIDIFVYFIVTADTYNKIKIEMMEENRRKGVTELDEIQLLNTFNSHLIFQYREFETDKKITYRGKSIYLDDEEIETLSERGNEYDNGIMKYLEDEEDYLLRILKHSYEEIGKSFESVFKGIQLLLKKEYMGSFYDIELSSEDGQLFNLMYTIFYINQTYLLLNLGLAELGDIWNFQRIEEELNISYITTLLELEGIVRDIKGKINEDVFLNFAAYILCVSEKKRIQYTRKVLREIFQHISSENTAIESKQDMFLFTNETIENEKTQVLLDYFLPNKEKRKSSDRNDIKNRLKYIVNLLNHISYTNPIWGTKRYGRQVKMAYELIYTNNNDTYKIKSTIPKQFYDGKISDIARSDTIVLTEKYIYNEYKVNGCIDNYKEFFNYRMEFLDRMERILDILLQKGD